MVAYKNIPLEMREEIAAAVEFIKKVGNRLQELEAASVTKFGDKLAELLSTKFLGHWYLDNPQRDQTYRSISSNECYKDVSILEACAYSGLRYEDLALPEPIFIWIDPYKVFSRLGEDCIPHTVATFLPMIRTMANRRSTPMPEAFWVSTKAGLWWTPVTVPETRKNPGVFRIWSPLWFPPEESKEAKRK
ncbi:maternal B9.15 protein-like [Hyperolius riggenbachi]|uniref:maternal B9.15 protein-like n=1 Tax=Hyperolius riggenbachi TaxID=752182 RepID=UPI0035A3C280